MEIINRPKAITDHKNLCFKCLQKRDNINTYTLYRSEYGSSFDNYYIYLQLCDECKKEIKDYWFNEEPEITNGYCANYKYEKNILNYIETLPLEGQELFWASCAYGACVPYIKGQDYIDMELDILPEWKYKQYCMYIPYRLKIAGERFELCNEPVNITYSDNSKGCWCPFGGSGDYGQKIGLNRTEDCYECDQYHKRYTKIKEMTNIEYKKYQLTRKAKVLLEKEPKIENY